MKMLVGAALVVFAGAAQSLCAQCDEYEVASIFMPCGPPIDFTGLVPTSVSDTGIVGGFFDNCNAVRRAGVWTLAGGVQNLHVWPANDRSRVEDVNRQGLAVGKVSLGQTFNGLPSGDHAILWEGGSPMVLPKLAGDSKGEAFAINRHGHAVGHTGGTIHAVMWPYGARSPIELIPGSNSWAIDINDHNVITGTVSPGTLDGRAFIWSNGGHTVLPPAIGAVASNAYALNNRNDVVGEGDVGDILQCDNGASQIHRTAFAWIDGRMIDLPLLDDYPMSRSLDINDRREILLEYDNPCMAGVHSFQILWSNGALWDPNDYLARGAGVTDVTPMALNNHGQIAGVALRPDGFPVTVLLTPRSKKQGDTNCDGFTGIADLLSVIGYWSGNQSIPMPSPIDLDRDLKINITDLLTVITNWG